MKQYQISTTLDAIEQISRDIFRISLHAPPIAKCAKPGQFVMVRTREGLDPLLRRPFSIHDVPDPDHITLLYKVVGKGTDLLSQFKRGQQISIVGPLGNTFTFSKTTKGCLVGGGMGIAPLLFLARELAKKHDVQDHVVLLGARSIQEIEPLVHDFTTLGFTVHAATDDGSFGHHGFVTELIGDDLGQIKNQVYVCGPTPLMAAVAKKCLSLDLPCQASLETHMACGLGACLGCTITGSDASYKHVCKHGPIFDANEVLWTI